MAEIGYASTVLNKLTKKIYENGAPFQGLEGSPFIEWVKKSTVDLGTDVTRAIQTSYAEGTGIRTDRQALPDAQAPDFLNPTFDTVDIYQVLEITGKEIERTKNSTAAIANYLDLLLSTSRKNFYRDLEFQAFNDSTGTRGITANDESQGTDVVVDLTATYTPIRGLRVNQKIEFWNETAPAQLLTTTLVKSVDILNGTITVDLDTDVPGGSYIYVQGNRNAEINGLGNLVNNSSGPATVLGISSTNPIWQSQVLTNSGTARNLTVELLDKLFFQIKNQNDEEASVVWLDTVTQMVKWTGMVNRNFQVNGTGPGVKIDAHNKVTHFGSAEVRTSSMCPNNKIYMLQGSDFSLETARAYSPIVEEKAGNIWQLRDGYNLFQAKFWMATQLTCKSRRIHGYLGDLVTT
jgi:hypothetical protein